MKIIDGEGLLLGRVCSLAAKMALLGEEVKIVNCEKIVVSGDPQKIFAREREKRQRRGYPLKKAKLSNLPDYFVRRVVRGMLPYKKERGREAFKRIKCYRGIPEGLVIEKNNFKKIEKISSKKLPIQKYVSVGEICDWLRGRYQRKKPQKI